MWGKAIGMVVVAALLVGLTIGSSMANTLTHEPFEDVTWVASTFLSSFGSSHSSKSIAHIDANIDKIGIHGWLRDGGSNGKLLDEDEVMKSNDDCAELELYSPPGIYADYARADHTFEAPPYEWHPSTSDSN